MYRKSFEIIGYAYDAAFHCPACAVSRFTPEQLAGEVSSQDGEGNQPHPLFLGDSDKTESCDDCLEMLDV